MKFVYYFLVFLYFCNSAKAQFVFGVEAGISHNIFKNGNLTYPTGTFRYLGFRNIDSEPTIFEANLKIGYKFGVNTSYFIKNGIGFETGFYFRNAGSSVNSFQNIYDITSNFQGRLEIQYKYSLNTFEIPLKINYKTKPLKNSNISFVFSLGAYGNVQSSSSVTIILPYTENLNFYNNKAKLRYINEWNWNTLDVGLIAGCGIFFKLKNSGAIRLNYDYNRGLNKHPEFYNVSFQSQTFSIFYGKIF